MQVSLILFLVSGLVRTVAQEIFKRNIRLTISKQEDEDILADQRVQYHTTFQILEHNRDTLPASLVKKQPQHTYFDQDMAMPMTQIPSTAFCELFPYHILFDRKLVIKQCGLSLRKLSHNMVRPGVSLADVIQLVNPQTKLTLHHMLRFINAVFMFHIKDTANSQNNLGAQLPPLILKGKSLFSRLSSYV